MNDKADTAQQAPLPAQACLPINKCNLPCHVLGGLSFQQHPQALELDGVHALHHQLFAALDAEAHAEHRAVLFAHHMRACFQLDDPEAQGHDSNNRLSRIRSDYRQLLRGWLFNADGREAAVIKGWVESRFGLQARNHRTPLGDRDGEAYRAFQQEWAEGLYNTNALLDQLDLLYSYCQYELARQHPDESHRLLYRGINRLADYDILASPSRSEHVLLLNNVNAFSSNRERADEFGDRVIRCRVPGVKLLYVPGLLPGVLKGEDEHLVIGGLYRVRLESP